MSDSDDALVAIQDKLADCQIEWEALVATNYDLYEKLKAADARAYELFNELGIVQNEAHTQQGELTRQVAVLTAERDEARFTISLLADELAALRQIALTNEALIDVAGILTVEARYTSSLSEMGGMKHVADRIRAARGVKEGG